MYEQITYPLPSVAWNTKNTPGVHHTGCTTCSRCTNHYENFNSLDDPHPAHVDHGPQYVLMRNAVPSGRSIWAYLHLNHTGGQNQAMVSRLV